PPARLGQAERGERGGPLVDPDVQPQPSALFQVTERHGQRGAPRSRGEDHLPHPAPGQFVAERQAERRSRVHGRGTSSRNAAAAAARSRHGAGSVSKHASRAASTAGRQTGSAPASGTSGSAVTSPASSDMVASPHAQGGSGRAAASATPAARRTEGSAALG